MRADSRLAAEMRPLPPKPPSSPEVLAHISVQSLPCARYEIAPGTTEFGSSRADPSMLRWHPDSTAHRHRPRCGLKAVYHGSHSSTLRICYGTVTVQRSLRADGSRRVNSRRTDPCAAANLISFSSTLTVIPFSYRILPFSRHILEHRFRLYAGSRDVPYSILTTAVPPTIGLFRKLLPTPGDSNSPSQSSPPQVRIDHKSRPCWLRFLA